ncbi:MAG: replicative DNA helicase [Candidatus Omnitrophota bacterium]
MDVKELALEKVPPQNIEAEMAVLGSMLIEEEAIASGIEMLDADFFYKDNHKKIFSAVTKLFNINHAVDIITLVEELKKEGMLDEVGGASYITSLASAVPTAANLIYYANIVKEKAILRNLITTATLIVTECFEQSEQVEALLDRAEQRIFDITGRTVETYITPIKELVQSSITTIDNLYKRKENITGIPTGFHEFDIMTAGLQQADLVIIAGRPSMGKSALVSCIAEHAGIIEKIPLVIFSLEMSKEHLVQRMLCSHARVDAHKVRTGFLAQSDWPRLTSAAGRLSDAPMFIDDSPSMSVLELRAKARRLKAQHGIRLVIVDYLQMIKGHKGAENRQQEISEISRGLKALAKELKIPVVAVSQLSRSPEKREDRRPQLADLRESGAIEQDADLVALLFREELYAPTDENRGKSEIIVAKQRNGPIGSLWLTFIKEYTRFENLSRREE